jgi:hypothetical protein
MPYQSTHLLLELLSIEFDGVRMGQGYLMPSRLGRIVTSSGRNYPAE